MTERDFPKPVNEIVATIADIFRHQNLKEFVELLERAHAYLDELEYDNWNGGTSTWALRLEVPVSIFASIEPRLAHIEKTITEKLTYFDRMHSNDHLQVVTISPSAPGSSIVTPQMTPSEMEVRRLWPDGQFRLFLSHVAEHKVAVVKLKEELALYGVAAFVAHEDIEPTQEWRDEIELGLQSMHALVAFITPDFHASFWTDQEVGWAFGRGALVVPIRLGKDPYGFAGKYQGVSGTLDQPVALASSIVNTLLDNPRTHSEMRRPLAHAFKNVNSFAMARRFSQLVVKFTDFTNEEKAAIGAACTDNPQIAKAFGVTERIYDVIGKPPRLEEKSNDVPF